MPRVLFTTNIGRVIQGVKVRKARVYEEVNAAAVTIAEITNTELIPEFYPGRVQKAIRAVPEAYQVGGRLSAVRTRRYNRLFDFYEFGVKGHDEPKTGITFMAFQWAKLGGAWTYRYHVHHPGYPGRHRLPDLKEAVREVAYREWHAALERALLTPGSL